MTRVKFVPNMVSVSGIVSVNIMSVSSVTSYTVNAPCVKLKHVDIVNGDRVHDQ
jgi:hypothetical protein